MSHVLQAYTFLFVKSLTEIQNHHTSRTITTKTATHSANLTNYLKGLEMERMAFPTKSWSWVLAPGIGPATLPPKSKTRRNCVQSTYGSMYAPTGLDQEREA